MTLAWTTTLENTLALRPAPDVDRFADIRDEYLSVPMVPCVRVLPDFSVMNGCMYAVISFIVAS